MKSILTILIVSCSLVLFAQTDSSYVHYRKKAAFMSLVLPGSGQIYNEFGHRKVQGRKNISWWRAPLYIGGLVATGYFSYVSIDSAATYKREWLHRDANGDNVNLYPQFSEFEKNDIQTLFERKAQHRDYAIVGFALVYALNIADAFIDAHFVTFDVSDDLSLNFKPKYYGRSEFGLSLSFNFD